MIGHRRQVYELSLLVGTLAVVFFGGTPNRKGEIHELLFAVFLLIWWLGAGQTKRS